MCESLNLFDDLQSQEFDATDTAPDGARFTTQVTFIRVGDAMVSATEIGTTSAHVSRDTIPSPPRRDRRRTALGGLLILAGHGH